jgi:hypothetical protein
VNFYPYTWLLASAELYQGPKVATNIPAGTYDITAVAYDGDLTRYDINEADYQFNEQYYLRLYNDNTVIGISSSTPDLPYDVNIAIFNGKINDDYVLTSDINYVQTVHPFYPPDVWWHNRRRRI